MEIDRESVEERHEATQERVANGITDLTDEERGEKNSLSLAPSHRLIK